MLKPATTDIDALKLLDERLRWLSAWTIHHANHIRESADGLKVGGHQASCASMTAIMAALYFHALGPNDRVAVKPHAGPVLHAIHYLLGSQSLRAAARISAASAACKAIRAGPRTRSRSISRPARSASASRSPLFASLVQDYLTAHGWMAEADRGRFVALIGDAELDEGNIYECLIEGAQARHPQLLVDRRLQPPEPRRDQRRPHVRAVRRDFRSLRLAGGRAALRQEAAGRARRAIRRSRAGSNSCPNAELSALHYQGGGGMAGADRGRPRQEGSGVPQGA